MAMEMDPRLKSWRPDEVAECLSVSSATYAKLWEITADLEASGDAVPMGGDGSNGTIEMPPEPDAYPSGKMGAVWHLLSELDQADVNKAIAKEYGP